MNEMILYVLGVLLITTHIRLLYMWWKYINMSQCQLTPISGKVSLVERDEATLASLPWWAEVLCLSPVCQGWHLTAICCTTGSSKLFGKRSRSC